MKILFIYKHEFVEPLGIMYLSAYLKKHGHECDFLDVAFEDDILRSVKKISPGIIAYSIMSGKHKFFRDLNAKLKREVSFFSVFGGPHCTFFPEFIYNEGVDAICRGEGELPLLELTTGLERGEDLTTIKNIWIKKDGKVYKNDIRDYIKDLDIIPFPDRELINKYNHYRLMPRRGIMSGRGCPYKCSYCFNHSYHDLYKDKGSIIRRRSVDNVIEELKYIKKVYGPKRFHFWDDTFDLDSDWVKEFCRIYKKEVGIPFLVNVRMNLAREDVAIALKDAGCITVVTAIESGNEHIRNDILKRNISEKQMLNASSIFRRCGLNLYIGNMIGLPDETLSMAMETLSLNRKCRPSYSMVCIYMPYPGTKLCEYSKEKGYFDGNIDSMEETTYNKSVMKIDKKREFERLHHLFSIGVAFPFLIPLIKVLIKLPMDHLYQFVWHAHRAWAYFFKVKYMDISELFIRE